MADKAISYPHMNPAAYGTRRFDGCDLRFLCLLAAVVLYALRGEPTPDSAGMAEILVGGLLIAAVGVAGLGYFARSGIKAGAPLNLSAWLLLSYGLSVPVIGALVQGNDLLLIVRDIVPFLFLLMPFFLLPLLARKNHYAVWFRRAVLFAGLTFSLRILVPLFSAGGQEAGAAATARFLFASADDHAYLANAPTVLFAALFLTGAAGKRVYRAVSMRSVSFSFLLFGAALAPFAVMVMTGQRAGIVLAAAGLAFLLLPAFVKSPRRALAPLLLAVCAGLYFLPEIQGAAMMVAEKTAAVGLNKRGAETAAVFDFLGQDAARLLFGAGWGAGFESPAVGGMTVNYTHSLLTSYALKTGLAGGMIVIFYLLCLAGKLYGLLFRDPVMAVALAAPFLINVFLYASFKSLDFGLLLLLAALWAERGRSLHPRAVCSIQKDNSGNEKKRQAKQAI